MKNLITIIVLFLLASTQISAQGFKKATRIGIMTFPVSGVKGTLPAGLTVNEGWVVPPLFIESERRFGRFFTLGSELAYGSYRIDTEVEELKSENRMSNISFEAQFKASVPLFDMFEAYAQFGIGYAHTIISSKTDIGGTAHEMGFSWGSITKTYGLGGSVIFFDSFGLFLEAGMMNYKSLNTIEEIISEEGLQIKDLPELDQRMETKSAYGKVGLLFTFG